MRRDAESLLVNQPVCAPATVRASNNGCKDHRSIDQDLLTLERSRIARELHDTLFQGFVGASLLLHDAVENIPADWPTKATLTRALRLMHRGLDEGRVALEQLRSPGVAAGSLEQALATFGDEFTPAGNARARVYVVGQPRALKPAVHRQIYLIAREALANAIRHSKATVIEADINYARHRVSVVVRDNGCGIDQHDVAKPESHWGLLGMRERASDIGAQLRILSGRGAGTEVELSVPADLVTDQGA